MKIPYGKQWISDDDIVRVTEVLRSDYLTTGPFVKEFEDSFAKYVGAKHAVAVANGTAALHLAAQVLGVKKGTHVISTPMSFAATSNCIFYNSGIPVFADITKRGLIDPREIEKEINTQTIGIIPVHYMGLPCEMDEIQKIAKENDLFIIEDACHAIGAKYRNSPIGACMYSDLSVFSFHPVKHITTGEGGIITTNDSELDSKLRILRTHGITKDRMHFKTNHSEPWYQEMQYLGFNYRLTDIQAALGLSQLSRMDVFLKRRRELAKIYNDFFEKHESIEPILEGEQEYHAYHLYVVKLHDSKMRQDFYEYLKARGILCQIHYVPIYWHPYYRENGFEKEFLPETENFYERIISLPMYPAITDDDMEFILESIGSFKM